MKLINLIEEHERYFLIVKKRFYFLENILKELDSTTKSKRFNIRGDVIYQMLRDSYSMLVIDLASIGRGMIRKKGFFRKLPNFAKELEKPTQKLIAKSYFAAHQRQDSFLESLILKSCLESYGRLFPGCISKGKSMPTQDDFNDLKENFYSICEAIIKDRDRNRAHSYENAETRKESVRLLTIKDLEEKFFKLEKLMNDLRLICSNSSYGSNDVNFSNSEGMAKSIVDLILIGDHNSINIAFGISQDMKDSFGIYPYEYRNPYYEELHYRHEKKIQYINEEEARKFREIHGDYSKIKLPIVSLNFEIIVK
ncbi:MAG: hypothetical protein COW00_17845 [Bdellovibrio sp. CG12_big_fil_rev_8_21_14_0_65_39_13]|nr:MAG: hypothetical protein COW78_06325 [Bdellovibrio sp. CG22_combo_CG10-13_8_21_14_all_39_27]PIQ57972.1 MAG: hypothetical protein COW00_17845 [Bdellovibrio sp. CG12_big_fil_rev_8_21_14_0_65_39_13]PIR32894.1 MAG: hypothetical protein COV37_17495 [Bdellovibrio sp. CG11_big_fil_rev_8_21_14_0_20_39_38]